MSFGPGAVYVGCILVPDSSYLVQAASLPAPLLESVDLIAKGLDEVPVYVPVGTFDSSPPFLTVGVDGDEA